MFDDDLFDNSFCNELKEYADEYELHLLNTGLTKITANKHGYLLSTFFWFLDGYTQVQGFEDITKAYLNGKFRAHLNNDYKGEFTDTFVNYVLKNYFGFIIDQYGISTPLIKSTLKLK